MNSRRTPSQSISCSTCLADAKRQRASIAQSATTHIDQEVGRQVTILRNVLQLDSGTGRPPPMLKNIPAGDDVLNLTNDGRPEPVAKPFTIRTLDDGSFELQITARSPEEMARSVPHIAAKLGV